MTNQFQRCRLAKQDESYVGNPPTWKMPSKDTGQVMWRGRWIILFATVSVLAATFVYLNVATPVYTSASKIHVAQESPGIMTELEDGVMTRSKNYLYTQAELLRSEPVLAGVLNAPSMKQRKTMSELNYSVGYLKGNLDIQIGKRDDIITVSLDSPDPNEAAQIVNAVVDSYISYNKTLKSSIIAELSGRLDMLEGDYKKELSEKTKAIAEFKKKNSLLSYENGRDNITLQSLESLSSEAYLTTLDRKAIYESIKAMVSDPVRLKRFIEAERAKGAYITPGSERAELESTLNKLDHLRQATSDQTELKTLGNEIDKVKKRIADLDDRFVQGKLGEAEQQYLAAKDKEDQVTKQLEQERQQLLDLNEQQAEYAILQFDWERTQEFGDSLEQRRLQLNVREGAGASNIRRIEVARPAPVPSKPQKATSMVIALVLGPMLGGALALFRDWVDHRLHSAEEISTILSTPLVGAVPSMPRWRWQTVGMRGKMAHLMESSPTAEAYRTIRTAVSFGVRMYQAKTIVITSPAQGDGKTTLVSNLAIAMAQAGERVLVVDADFRNPVQHRIFGISKAPGLSSLVAGPDVLDKLEEAIQRGPIAGLDILPSGPLRPNPLKILNNGHFCANIMARLSSKYDRILIDTPPVIPFTDACVLAAICDATLLVVRAEKSTLEDLQQTRDALLGVGAHIVGAVANDVPHRNGKYGRYCNGYYRGYKYRRAETKSQNYPVLDVPANPRHHVPTGSPTS